MATNKKLQMTIDFALKNAKKLEDIIASLREKHGVNIDDSQVQALAAELQNLSGQDVEITADGAQAEGEAETVADAVESIPDDKSTKIEADAGDALSTLSKLSMAYQGLSQVYSQVAGKVSALIETYSVQEESDRKLLSALKQKTTAHAQYFNFLAQEADKIQQITTIGDEQTQLLMSSAVNMGVSLDNVSEATKGAIGLSEKFAEVGLSQETAMKGIALAYQGEFTQLSRYIPELRSANTAAEKMAILQREMASGFTIATEAITTNTGKMEQLKNQYGDLQEVVGASLMQAAVGWGQALGIIDDHNQKYAEMRKRMEGLQGDIIKMRSLYDVYRMQEQTEETQLAMQVLREMAEEWERSQQAAETAQNAETARLERQKKDLDDIMLKLSTLSEQDYSLNLRTTVDGEPQAETEPDDVDPFYMWNGFSQDDLEAANAQMSQTLIAQAFQLNNSLLAMAKSRISNEMNAELAKLRKSAEYQAASAEEQAKLEDDIRKEYAKKQNQLAIAERVNSIAQIAFNTAQGIMKAVAAFPLSAGQPWASIIAAMGAAQTGVVLGTPLPKYAKGGIADSPSIFGEAGPEAAVPLPDGRSIPVNMNGGVSSKKIDELIAAVQAVNANIAALDLSVTIETTDPEARIRSDNERLSIMQGAGDDGQPL
jgi:outer membrane murein-binding lipoprotein Lpp